MILGLGNSRNFIFQNKSFLNDVVALGISQFDVAPVYGNGLNEVLLGKALREHNLTVTTKLGLESGLPSHHNSIIECLAKASIGKALGIGNIRNYTPDFLLASHQRSIRRLGNGFGIPPIFLLHEFVPVNHPSSKMIVEFLENLKVRNLISNYGIAPTYLPKFSSSLSLPIIQTNFEDALTISEDSKYGDTELRAFGVFRNFSKLDTLEQKNRLIIARQFLIKNNLNKVIIGTSSINHLKFAIEQLDV